MKHYFIINPAAGKTDRTIELSQKITALCKERNLDYTVEISHAPGQCEVLARAAAAQGQPCRIYACGGDGTLNEVVNGAAAYDNAAVTVYPSGSGNDFIKASSDPAAFLDIARLLDPEEQEFDLIQVGDRYGLNICSIGIDARVGTEVAKYKRLPLVSGSGAYLLSTLANVIKGVYRHYVVEVAGEVIDANQTLICACNGNWYGGGFHPVPDAVLNDGLLDVLLIRPVSRLKVATVIGAYKAGKFKDYPDLIRYLRVPEITVHCDEPSRINIDGELLVAKDVTFRIADQKLRFFYPKGLCWANQPVPAAAGAC